MAQPASKHSISEAESQLRALSTGGSGQLARRAYSSRRARPIRRWKERLAMAVYKRGKVWWYTFEFQGRRIQESSGFTNKKLAIDAESIRRTKLLERRAGLSQTKLAPKFEEHVERFLEWSKQQHRPKTRELHGMNCDTLMRFFRGCWLD